MKNSNKIYNFDKAINVLGIEDYKNRILQSHSTGELFYLNQYITIANDFCFDENNFRDFFEKTIEFTKKNWQRPDSVYQHVYTLLKKN